MAELVLPNLYLLTFVSKGLLLLQKFTKSKETLENVQQETVVLQHILEECVDVLRVQNDVSTLPQSFSSALTLCTDRYVVLLETLDRILSRTSKVERINPFSSRNKKVMSSYRAFRESALLLRDLTTDLRMNRQLLAVSREIDRLLLNQDDYSSGGEEVHRPGGDEPEREDVENENSAKPKAEPEQHGDDHGTANLIQGILASKRRKARSRLESFNRNIGELLASDFTRDLIVVFETDSEEPSKRFKRVFLRNKIDTYSDENFISHKIIDRYAELIKPGDGGGTGMIQVIPEKERKERELRMLGGYKFVPEREIKLEWYRPKDAQKRETTFIIVDNDPPFDTLICKADWDLEAPKSAYPIFGNHKNKKQTRKEKETEEEQKRAAHELIRKQLKEASRLADMGRGDGAGDGTAPGPAAAAS